MRAANGQRWVRDLALPLPSLDDNTADADRLLAALRAQLGTRAVDVDFGLLQRLPRRLRRWGYRVRCVVCRDRHCWLVTDVADPNGERPLLGLAVDLGTTRIVLRLLDLETGEVLAEEAFGNPQCSVGPDILTRVHYADRDDGLGRLQRMLIDGMNRHIRSLCARCERTSADVHLLALAGNTAMTHLFLGLPPRWLIREPYIPASNTPGWVAARDVGLEVAPQARVFVLPNVGAYFGGDLIAGILYAGMHEREDPAFLVDVGTNAEVVLGNRDWLIACAGAAGPALEAGVADVGMVAGDGVIDRVAIDPETRHLEWHTIGDKAPKGICGSGLIDLVAHLFRAGMIDFRGRLVRSKCAQRLKEVDGVRHLVLVPAHESATGRELTIDQRGLTSLKKAKAAMFTILETVAASVGLSLADVTAFFVAGTFGSLIDPQSAITIGMLPDLPPARYRVLGNSSLGGSTLLLQSTERLADVYRIRDRTTYLELNVNQDFMNRFSDAQFFPHTDPSRFPSVSVGQP